MARTSDYALALIIGVAFYFIIYKNPKFQSWISGIGGGGAAAPSAPTPTTTTTTKGGKSKGGKTKGGGGVSGAGGAPTGATGPAGKPAYPVSGQTIQLKDSGKSSRHYASDGSSGTTEYNSGTISSPNLAAIVYYTHPSSCSGGHGDEADIKLWGPGHSDSACCYCIISIDGTGKVCWGREGPHPSTDKCVATLGNVGSIKGKRIGLQHVIWKTSGGAHQEAWVDTGGGFKKIGEREGVCGKSKTSTSPASGAIVQFRCDCSGVKVDSATVSEITPGGSGGGGSSTPAAKTPASTTPTTPAKSSKKSSSKSSKKTAATARIPYIMNTTRISPYSNVRMLDYQRYPEEAPDHEHDCGFDPDTNEGRIELDWFKQYQAYNLSHNIPFSEPVVNYNDYYDHYVRNPHLLNKKRLFKVGNLGGFYHNGQ